VFVNLFAVLHKVFKVLMRIHIPQIVVQILKRSSGEHSVCVVAAATKFL
jgi:hypothetical protein